MKLDQLYKEILLSLGLQINEDNLVSMVVEGTELPCMCQEKRLALPTTDVLRAADWGNVMAFHPLSENALRGESPVLKTLRKLINYRLTAIISVLATELLEIAVNSDYHSKLSPTQSEFLDNLSAVDGKTVKALNGVLTALDTGDAKIVSIYLKRGGSLKGDKHTRLAVTAFPLVEELDEDTAEVFGVKMRKKDVKALRALFDYILPNAEKLETYSHGSNSLMAPYFDALIHAYINVAKQLNKVTRRFKKHLGNPAAIMVDLGWEEHVEDLSKFRDMIPVLEGNDGEVVEGKEEDTPKQTPTSPAMSEMAKRVAGGIAPSKPAHTEPTPAVETAEPGSGINAAGYTPPKPSRPTNEPARTNRGLDWNAVRKNNPMFQPQGGGSQFASAGPYQTGQFAPSSAFGGMGTPVSSRAAAGGYNPHGGFGGGFQQAATRQQMGGFSNPHPQHRDTPPWEHGSSI